MWQLQCIFITVIVIDDDCICCYLYIFGHAVSIIYGNTLNSTIRTN